jgi:hypothetical protein
MSGDLRSANRQRESGPTTVRSDAGVDGVGVPPSLIFALILATTLGLLFHSIFGQRLWQLPLFVISAIIGMLGGLTAGTLAGWDLLRMGNLPMVAVVGGAVLALGICWFFTAPLESSGRSRLRRVQRGARGQNEASA